MSLNKFIDSKRRVIVVGDVMLDRYFEGSAQRISPEAPVPVLKVTQRFDRPGGAANVALNIASLGVAVTLLAYAGDDIERQALQALLAAGGVDCDFVIAKHACTIVKLRALSMRQQMLRMDFEDDFTIENHPELLDKLDQHLTSHDLVVFSDYAKGTLDKVSDMIAASKSAGKMVLVDPKGSDFKRYAGATILTPNMSEFFAVVGQPEDENEFAERGKLLCAQYGIENLLVTRGEKGMTLIRPDQDVFSIPAEAKEVFDVTGAGDTVIGTIAATMASGVTLVDSMHIANCAAGIVVSRKGTAAVTADELSARLNLPGNFVESSLDACEQIAAAKRSGRTIVMTNGCFDILHAGHVDYLTKARALGDCLVVAVNSDASISRLKGASRPVNRLEHRMAVLAALKAVDWVVPFDGSTDDQGLHVDTPRDLIRSILPDILVKGGDYTAGSVVGAAEVIAAGGDVKILSFVDGLSTTKILKTLSAD